MNTAYIPLESDIQLNTNHLITFYSLIVTLLLMRIYHSSI